VILPTVIINPSGKIGQRWDQLKAAGHAAVVRSKLGEMIST
jgi:hypothetical protein